MMVDPGKLRFLVFARGSVRNPTLANRVFWTLPGVVGVRATLANVFFERLPGVERGCATLANRVFRLLPGFRREI